MGCIFYHHPKTTPHLSPKQLPTCLLLATTLGCFSIGVINVTKTIMFMNSLKQHEILFWCIYKTKTKKVFQKKNSNIKTKDYPISISFLGVFFPTPPLFIANLAILMCMIIWSLALYTTNPLISRTFVCKS